MNIFNKIILFCIVILLYSCSGNKKSHDMILEKDLDLQLIDAYKEGKRALDEGDILFAVKKFNEAEILFPQSIWAPRSALMAAYSFYAWAYYGDAISEAERYLKRYPKDKNLDKETNVSAYFLVVGEIFSNLESFLITCGIDTYVKNKQKFKIKIPNN